MTEFKFGDSILKLTKEEEKLFRELFYKLNDSEMCEVFNISYGQYYKICRYYKLYKEKLKRDTRNRKSLYDNLTIEQRAFIKENYIKMKSNKICKMLDIDYKTLRAYASSLGMKKEKYLTDEKIKIMLDRTNYNVLDYIYKIKEPIVEISKPNKYRKYELNENYFEEINNEFKAYWLGFIYADGYINKKYNILEITLQSSDKTHIQKFLNSIQSNAPIKDKISNNGYTSSRIAICNSKICLDLKDKECYNNKSLILTFPKENIVPKKYIRHFIRGYFDGDGCVYINKEKKIFICSFVGTEVFLEEINKIFNENIGLTKTSIYKKDRNNAHDIHWGGWNNVEKIYKYLYKDSNIFLDRKFEKFNSLFRLD